MLDIVKSRSEVDFGRGRMAQVKRQFLRTSDHTVAGMRSLFLQASSRRLRYCQCRGGVSSNGGYVPVGTALAGSKLGLLANSCRIVTYSVRRSEHPISILTSTSNPSILFRHQISSSGLESETKPFELPSKKSSPGGSTPLIHRLTTHATIERFKPKRLAWVLIGLTG